MKALVLPLALLAGCGPKADLVLGEKLYAQHCAVCHGANLEGQPDWRKKLPNGRPMVKSAFGRFVSTSSSGASSPSRKTLSVPAIASANTSTPTSNLLSKTLGSARLAMSSGPAKNTLVCAPVPRKSKLSQLTPASGSG